LTNIGSTTCPTNLFWQIGDSATFGTGTSFVGNVLALNSITLTTSASLNGRALARNGAVTLDTNNVSIAACAGGGGGTADIPALSPLLLLLLSVTLATAAVLVLRR
jgi:hypothetical protein